MCTFEQIANPYRLGDHIQFKTEQNGWMHCSVVDSENNWILQRFISNGVHRFDSENRGKNERKIHVLKHENKLRLVKGANESDSDDSDESESEHSNNDFQIIK